jgi:hypothetical protein
MRSAWDRTRTIRPAARASMMNSHVAALRFFFTTTLDRPDLSRKLIRVP